MIRAVVLDVEGTTSSARHVYEHLFPYSYRLLPSWVAARGDDPRVVEALREAATIAGRPDAPRHEVIAVLRDWIEQDLKITPLKTIQGLMWQDGLAAGALTSHVYDDVPPALQEWTRRGLTVHIFSSGSVAAQRAWFRYSTHGDLSRYLTGFFDTANAGGKRSPDSYRAITRVIGVPPAATVFLSDVTAELDAARSAGWHTVAVRRDDAPSLAGDHLTITTFEELDLTLDPPGRRPLRADGPASRTSALERL